MCVFCKIPPADYIVSNELAYVVLDKNATTRCHFLIIPKRHVCNVEDLLDAEVLAMKRLERILIYQMKEDKDYQGCNLRFNQGKIAGQTIEHLHEHIVMRYDRDGLNILGGNF